MIIIEIVDTCIAPNECVAFYDLVTMDVTLRSECDIVVDVLRSQYTIRKNEERVQYMFIVTSDLCVGYLL